MELQLAQKLNNKEGKYNESTPIIKSPGVMKKSIDKPPGVIEHNPSPFIKANTKSVSLSCLKNDCIIPVFAKDNEKTIAHQEFIEIAQECMHTVFPEHLFEAPEVRVSHQVKGRVPDAIYKSAKELLAHEKTQYFERMAFLIRIPSITENINGNDLSLVVGGVRAYNQENLYSKKTIEKFKVFIGFQNMVCCNLCISTDGFQSELRISSYEEFKNKLIELFQSYQIQQHLDSMSSLSNYHLTEHQFAQLLGKTRLYHHLPKADKLIIPSLELNEGQMNTIAKDYYKDSSFCRDSDGSINLWKVFNLFTSANKSSYIDTFLDRNLNAFSFSQGLSQTLDGEKTYDWFLN